MEGKGRKVGKAALGLKPGLRVSFCGTRDQAARQQSQPSRQLRRGAPGEEGNGGSCPQGQAGEEWAMSRMAWAVPRVFGVFAPRAAQEA